MIVVNMKLQPFLHSPSMRKRFLPKGASFFWLLSYVVLSLYQKLFYRISVCGSHNIPENGPVVLASNHTSGHDIIILGCTCTRQIFFMAKQELFRHPLVAAYFRRAGVFPVRRGENDRQAIATALTHLRQGRVLGMFPEGKRFDALTRGKTGVIRLAMKVNAPIVPVAIVGARQIRIRRRLLHWHRDRVSIHYGEPLHVVHTEHDNMQNLDNYEIAEGLTDELMHAIARMLPAEMRGAYADV